MVSGQAKYQLGKTKSSIDDYVKQAHAESIRLLYVAITRAEHRCYLGMIDDAVNANSSLHLILNTPVQAFYEHNNNHETAEDVSQCELASWLSEHALSQKTNGISFQEQVNKLDPNSCFVDVDNAPLIKSVIEEKEAFLAPEFLSLDIAQRSAWIMSSFSNLSRFQKDSDKQQYDVAIPNQISLHSIETANEHLTLVTQRDFLSSNAESTLEDDVKSPVNTLRYSLKKGADTGNLLHDILEQVDFNSPDWQAASSVALTSYDDLDKKDVSALFDWLSSCLHTPLFPGFCMADLSLENTLREAEFYFPMPNLKVSELAKLLTQYRHHMKATFGFEALAISMPNIPKLSGMMHGFIDLIFEQDGKFYVADYKSTHLGDSAEDYRAANLHENNQHHLYDLQYLLYSLALHKYLQQNLAEYTFEQHFGGVFYLYLRGMSQDQQTNNASFGVFFDKVERRFIESLDGLFKLSPDERQLQGTHHE
jgi:exodeoxyribonuclease V beta subunit